MIEGGGRLPKRDPKQFCDLVHELMTEIRRFIS